MERKLVTVAVDGSAEFTTLTAAAAAQDPAQPLHFVLGAGTYYERPFWNWRITSSPVPGWGRP